MITLLVALAGAATCIWAKWIGNARIGAPVNSAEAREPRETREQTFDMRAVQQMFHDLSTLIRENHENVTRILSQLSTQIREISELRAAAATEQRQRGWTS